ncbi:N2,N2-dimethylguanosine tRNA methyltransferase, partial [Pseudoloma neurophilia]
DSKLKLKKSADKRVFLTNQNCDSLMANNSNFFHVIDIDPFGSFSAHVPFALKSIKHDGLLCLTATDTAVLFKNRLKCRMKYDTLINKTPWFAEMGLRAAISYIARQAAINEMAIEPVLSLSVDFYIRIFIRIKRNKTSAKKCLESLNYFYTCQCGYFLQLDRQGGIGNKNSKSCDQSEESKNVFNKNKCPICFQSLVLCGPLWTGKLHDLNFVESLPESEDKRVQNYLKMIKQEKSALFYHSISKISKLLKMDCPPMLVILSELLKRGYLVSFSHCMANAVKTDCPYTEMIKIFKENLLNSKNNKEFDPEAIKMCNTKYNREIMNMNGGPGSRYKKNK